MTEPMESLEQTARRMDLEYSPEGIARSNREHIISLLKEANSELALIRWRSGIVWIAAVVVIIDRIVSWLL